MSTTNPPTTAEPPLSPSRARALEILGRVLGAAPEVQTFRDNLRVFVPAGSIFEALKALKEEAGFDWLAELGGVDYLQYPGRDPERPRFEVHYVLIDTRTNDRIVVKTGVSDPDPSLPSVMPLWLGADWMEREVFDMYGVRFEGHPDLRRILMPEEFVAFPLRKDYPLRGRGERHNFPRITREQS